MPLSRECLAEWVARLVRIPSVNPLHAGARSGAPGEQAIALAIASWCSELGASDVVLDDVIDGRPNLYATFPGRTDRVVAIDAHLDTVTVENMTDPPFDGRIDGERVWGRGALDTKASMGVALALLEAWSAAGVRPEPTLLLVGTISEEAGGLLGAAAFRRWIETTGRQLDQLVICEPTDLAPVHGHKGALSLRITVLGQSAHSATPERGRNAIEAAARIVVALREHHDQLVAGAAATEVGTGTMLTSTISGGLANNVVPDRCVLTVGRRLAPGEDPDVEFARISEIASAAARLPIEVEPVVVGTTHRAGSPAFYQAPDGELVQVLGSATGRAPACAPFGTNALRYDAFAREKVVFGPGCIDDAHQPTECVRIDDLVTLAAAYEAWLRPG